MALLGVYNANDQNIVTGFEQWLGRRVDFHTQFAGEVSWDDFNGSVGWATGIYPTLDRAMEWSVPLIVAGATLGDAGRGAYNAHFRQVAQKIANARTERIVYVRTGWEFNGNWMKWASKGREKEFIDAFRQFSSTFRSVSDRFRLVWCPNIGQNDPAPSYPGSDFVDVVGMDFYHQPRWDPKEQEEAWFHMVHRPFGLQWHMEYAKAAGKPIAYPEWGVSSDKFDSYVHKVAEWFRAGDVVYQSYWDSNVDYQGKLSNGQNPITGAAFKAAFGSV